VRHDKKDVSLPEPIGERYNDEPSPEFKNNDHENTKNVKEPTNKLYSLFLWFFVALIPLLGFYFAFDLVQQKDFRHITNPKSSPIR
jgi:hypothetical protein